MATTKTVYLCLHGDTVIRAGSTLPQFVGTGLLGKGYYHYYRKLKETKEMYVMYEGKPYKIQKLNYD